MHARPPHYTDLTYKDSWHSILATLNQLYYITVSSNKSKKISTLWQGSSIPRAVPGLRVLSLIEHTELPAKLPNNFSNKSNINQYVRPCLKATSINTFDNCSHHWTYHSQTLEIIFDLPFGFPINNIISLSPKQDTSSTTQRRPRMPCTTYWFWTGVIKATWTKSDKAPSYARLTFNTLLYVNTRATPRILVKINVFFWTSWEWQFEVFLSVHDVQVILSSPALALLRPIVSFRTPFEWLS